MTLLPSELRDTRITRREIWGTRSQLLLWMGVLFAPPLLGLYGMAKYPPLVPDPRELLLIAVAVFAVTAPLMFALRKKLMPWRDKAPAIMWGSILCMPLIPIFAGQAVFLISNGALDRSPSTELRTVTVRVNHGKGVTLRSAADALSPIFLDMTQTDHDNVEPGDSVHLAVKPGALGVPWISGYTLRRTPLVTPRPRSRTNAVHQSSQ
jgi:hypothetical protein